LTKYAVFDNPDSVSATNIKFIEVNAFNHQYTVAFFAQDKIFNFSRRPVSRKPNVGSAPDRSVESSFDTPDIGSRHANSSHRPVSFTHEKAAIIAAKEINIVFTSGNRKKQFTWISSRLAVMPKLFSCETQQAFSVGSAPDGSVSVFKNASCRCHGKSVEVVDQ